MNSLYPIYRRLYRIENNSQTEAEQNLNRLLEPVIHGGDYFPDSPEYPKFFHYFCTKETIIQRNANAELATLSLQAIKKRR